MTRPHGLITTVAELRERCDVDPVTHCWHWRGATSNGSPRIWAFDHRLGDKRTMTGALAVWNIAFGRAPRTMAFRGCVSRTCLNPAHLREAGTKAEIGQHIRRTGALKGLHLEVRRANVARAHEACGIVPTPAAIVLAIRAAPAKVTAVALAAQYGMAHQTVGRIRRGESHRHLLPVQEAA